MPRLQPIRLYKARRCDWWNHWGTPPVLRSHPLCATVHLNGVIGMHGASRHVIADSLCVRGRGILNEGCALLVCTDLLFGFASFHCVKWAVYDMAGPKGQVDKEYYFWINYGEILWLRKRKTWNCGTLLFQLIFVMTYLRNYSIFSFSFSLLFYENYH